MKRYVPLLLAGALVAGPLSFAEVLAPTWRAESELKYADAPVASAATGAANDDMIVKSLVDALNKDAGLKGSKITVSTENGVATLVGTAQTEQQAREAAQIAAMTAGEGNVVNAIQPAKITYMKPPQMPIDANDQVAQLQVK
jgi:osmotically-inducible protein OsmY